MNQPVFLVKAPDYSQAAQAVERLFSRWEGADALKGKRVTIKPNLLMKRRPDEATTTHPEVVRGVILALRKRGVTDITLADSPGGLYTPAQLSGIYAATGMAQVAQETGVTLNLDCGWQEVPALLGERCRSFNLIDPVAQADCVISVAKLKTHCMTGLSGGVKNLFGCIPGLQKPELHYRYQEREPFCAMLLDLARTVAPVFTVVDAVESMEGDGPSAGQKRETGMLCGCESPFVLDRFLCDLLAFCPPCPKASRGGFARRTAGNFWWKTPTACRCASRTLPTRTPSPPTLPETSRPFWPGRCAGWGSGT